MSVGLGRPPVEPAQGWSPCRVTSGDEDIDRRGDDVRHPRIIHLESEFAGDPAVSANALMARPSGRRARNPTGAPAGTSVMPCSWSFRAARPDPFALPASPARVWTTTKPQVRGHLTCGWGGGQGRGRTVDLPILRHTHNRTSEGLCGFACNISCDLSQGLGGRTASAFRLYGNTAGPGRLARATKVTSLDARKVGSCSSSSWSLRTCCSAQVASKFEQNHR